MIDIVEAAVAFAIRAHVWAWRHALGDDATENKRDAPPSSDATSPD